MPSNETVIENEFQTFLKAGFGDIRLHEQQITELRRAFYGGAVIGTKLNPKLVMGEARYFFSEEARKHMEKYGGQDD